VKMMEGGEGGGREGRGVRRRCVRGQSDSVLTGALCLSPPRLSSIHPLWGEWRRDCRLQPPLGSDSVGETPRIWLAIASWPKKKSDRLKARCQRDDASLLPSNPQPALYGSFPVAQRRLHAYIVSAPRPWRCSIH
jgi:hypothetical protein